MNRPNWAEKCLATDFDERIQKAIELAEQKTSAEIVPVIVRASSTVGHVFSILTLLFTLIFYVAYSTFSSPDLSILMMGLLAAPVLAQVFSKFLWIQRLLTPQEDRNRQVDSRAEIEFFEHELNTTQGKTGVLVFISLMEHRVLVLTDQAIAEKHKPGDWSHIVHCIVTGIKQKDITSGLEEGVDRLGHVLSKSFPRQDDDQNELADRALVKE